MFDRTSRYHDVEETSIEVTDGTGTARTVRYIRRRFVPMPPLQRPATAHRMTEGERLDIIANQYLGDPTLFWHLVDGSDALDPAQLVAEPGTVIDIYLPGLGM